MRQHFINIILFSLLSSIGFCQDVIIKKDSTKIDAKILEISQTEIKYKIFNYQDGPLYIVSKNDIAYVIYSNGLVERIAEPKKTSVEESFPLFNNDTSVNRSAVITPIISIPKNKLSDYIQLNTELGLVINNSYCNIPKPSETHLRFASEDESFSKLNNKTCLGYSFSLNAILGKGNICKHILGISYLSSTSQYQYHHYNSEYESVNHTLIYTKEIEANYKSTTHYINLTNGIRFVVGKRINLENHLSLNIPFAAKNQVTGTVTESSYKNIPTPSGTSFNNVLDTKEVLPLKESNTRIMTGFTMSFMPKISYQLNIKQQKFELSYAYNIALFKYIMPWHTLGIAYYPFKALKSIPANSKTKSKLIKNPKLNIEAGALFNNGFTHTEENYSGVKTLNAAQYKTGYSLGLNFLHGGSNYFKQITTVSFTESYAELHQRHYYYADDKPSGYKYEYIYSTVYNSTLRFLNIGTGLRFTVLEHLNFDNGIAFNTPIYSRNKIVATRETNQSSYSGSSTSSTYEILENKTSSDFFLRKENWSFFAKMSYEFIIKQKRIGIFATWNYKLKNSAQWFVAGLTYYPFKKLR